MLTRQSWIALGVAVVLGLFAVFIANSFLTGSQEKARLGGTTKVAVASAPLAYGTDVTADKVRFVDYPNSAIPPGAFTNAAQLVPAGRKRVALMPIGVNEPILASKISGQGQGASIAALLPPGMRAASVRINDVSGVAGFIQPNDSVDVLVTRRLTGAAGPQGTQLTDVLIQNVRVIAMDQQARNADGSPRVAKTATLEVTPLDAQKLALAQEVGSLSLVLRKPGEANNPVVETISMNDLRYNVYGGARYPAPAVVGGFANPVAGAVAGAIQARSAQANAAMRSAAPARRAAAPRRSSPPPESRGVEVFRGTESNNYEVGGNGS